MLGHCTSSSVGRPSSASVPPQMYSIYLLLNIYPPKKTNLSNRERAISEEKPLRVGPLWVIAMFRSLYFGDSFVLKKEVPKSFFLRKVFWEPTFFVVRLSTISRSFYTHYHQLLLYRLLAQGIQMRHYPIFVPQ